MRNILLSKEKKGNKNLLPLPPLLKAFHKYLHLTRYDFKKSKIDDDEITPAFVILLYCNNVPFPCNISREYFLVSGHLDIRYFSSYLEERRRRKKQDTSFSEALSETNYHNHRADKCINHVYLVYKKLPPVNS